MCMCVCAGWPTIRSAQAHGLPAHLDLQRVLQDAAGERLHLPRGSGAEHARIEPALMRGWFVLPSPAQLVCGWFVLPSPAQLVCGWFVLPSPAQLVCGWFVLPSPAQLVCSALA